MLELLFYENTGNVVFSPGSDHSVIVSIDKLPTMLRGRINMLRLVRKYTYVDSVGYVIEAIQTAKKLLVHVDLDELPELAEVNVFIPPTL